MMTSMTLLVSDDCNLNCKYCFEKGGHRKCNMTEEIAEKSIDFFLSDKKSGDDAAIKYFGGEPLLNMDVIEKSSKYFINRCNEKGITPAIHFITNGTIFNDQIKRIIMYLYQNTHFVLNFSIDDIYSTDRIDKNNNNVLDLISSNLHKFIKFYNENNICLNKHFTINYCINKRNVMHLCDSYNYFINSGLLGFRFNIVREDLWDENDYAIFERQLDILTDLIVKNVVNHNFDIRYYTANNRLSKWSFNSKCSQCSACQTEIAVNYEGNIYPCFLYYYYNQNDSYGNVFTGMDLNKADKFIKYDPTQKYGIVKCVDCHVKDGCDDCIAKNLIYQGDINKIPKASCKMYMIQFKYKKILHYKLKNAGIKINELLEDKIGGI